MMGTIIETKLDDGYCWSYVGYDDVPEPISRRGAQRKLWCGEAKLMRHHDDE